MYEEFYQLLLFYAQRKHEFGFDLNDVSIALQFETYFELKMTNHLLMQFLIPKEMDKKKFLDFYYERLYELRKDVFRNVHDEPSPADQIIDNAKEMMQNAADYFSKKNRRRKQ